MPLGACAFLGLGIFAVVGPAGAQGRRPSAADQKMLQFSILSSSYDNCDTEVRFSRAGQNACYPRPGGASDSLRDGPAVSIRAFDSTSQVQAAVSYLGANATFAQLAADLSFDTNPALKPTHADGTDMNFWSEFEDVVAAQLLRQQGTLTEEIMSVHPFFAGDTMEQSAQRVRADFPPYFPNEQIKRLLGSTSLTLDPVIFGQPSCTSTAEFVNGPVALGMLAGWAVAAVSPAAFACKWHVGRARPEEVAFLVKHGSLNVPMDSSNVEQLLANMSLPTTQSFTAYQEGCPIHPSWPAMHSAASSASAWLDVVADLTLAQREEVRLLDFSIAYFRTFAGVHYESDNRAGLALGRKIVQRKLPDHLAEKYGCDASSKAAIKMHVQNKIAALSMSHPLDWATWTPPHWTRPSVYYHQGPQPRVRPRVRRLPAATTSSSEFFVKPSASGVSLLGRQGGVHRRASASQSDACTSYRFAKAAPLACFPRTGGASDSLFNTSAVSVRAFTANDQVQAAVSYLGAGVTFAQLAANLSFDVNPAFKPTHADDADPAPFWSEFHEVLAAQLLRRKGTLTAEIMSVHPLFAGDTMEQSAQRVRADFPPHFPIVQIVEYLVNSSLAMDPVIFKQAGCTSTAEFVNGPVALGRLAGWAIAEVSPAAFACKWHVGRARPEEVAYNVSKGDMQPPSQSTREAVANMMLTAKEDFTAYQEGCPVHPSWPAMHSAASSLSTWLDVVADLTPAQREEVRLLDFSIAYFRTFAGVHYGSDNRAGLTLGQKIMQEKLPDHLAEEYGCDDSSRAAIRAHVRAKVATLHSTARGTAPMDWATWTPSYWKSPSQLLAEQGAHATGDPHLQNMMGERFDIAREGRYVLLQIPKEYDQEQELALLRVDVDVQHSGVGCADMYIKSVNITGTWAGAHQTSGCRYLAGRRGDASWRQYGKVELKVVWGHSAAGSDYLNVFVRRLAEAGYKVGGLLGEDDHSEAAAPSKQCRRSLALGAVDEAGSRDPAAPVGDAASLAIAIL